MKRRLRCAAALIAASVTTAPAHDASGNQANVALVYDHVLPNVPGKSIRGVRVEYAPAGPSPAHLHPKSAFIYATVLEGAIRSQVNDEPVKTYRSGENFSEMPGDRHSVSENASTTERARLLAVFVVNTEETVLTTPIEMMMGSCLHNGGTMPGAVTSEASLLGPRQSRRGS